MERDFKYFRDKYGIAGARQKFESSCLYLFRKKYGEMVQTIEPNPGDDGIDVMIGDFADDGIEIFQCKYFIDTFDDSQISQINESFKSALKSNKFKMKKWTLCIPVDLDPKQMARWSKWKKDKLDSIENEIEIDIQLLTQSLLIIDMKEQDIYNSLFDVELENKLNKLLATISELKSITEENYKYVCEKILHKLTEQINILQDLANEISSFHGFGNPISNNSFKEKFQLLLELETTFEKDFSKLLVDMKLTNLALFKFIDKCQDYLRHSSKQIDLLINFGYLNPIEVFKDLGITYQVLLLKTIETLSEESNEIREQMNIECLKSNNIYSRKNTIEIVSTLKEKESILKIKINEKFNQLQLGKADAVVVYHNLENYIGEELGIDHIMFLEFSKSESKQFLDRTTHNFTGICEEGLLSLYVNPVHIIISNELNDEELSKLISLKYTANVVYHFIIEKSANMDRLNF